MSDQQAIKQVSLDLRSWKGAFAYSAWINILTLGLFYYWFAVSNRYAIFLYEHLGATPFDAVTRSRYWMAGLVVGGYVLVAHILISWLMRQVARLGNRRYLPPVWWQVWLACALPLGVGILWITMRFNHPTLPLTLALMCVAATWIGLAIALLPGAIAASAPHRLIWLALYGLGVIPALLLVRAVELPRYGLISPRYGYTVAIVLPLAGAVWLVLLRHIHDNPPSIREQYISALCLSYLVLPLLHFLFFVPPDYRYISTATNFFARDPGIQLLSFLVAGGVVYGANRLKPPKHSLMRIEKINP